MDFLKVLFWCLLAFIAAVFTLGNWTSIPIRLWGGLVAETNLPLLLLVAFLLGLVPALVYQHFLRWRLRQRLAAVERQLADFHALTPSTPSPTPPSTAPAGLPVAAPAMTAAVTPAVIAMPPVVADTDGATGIGAETGRSS